MRIWDIHPGYLNRFSLLGEHRELHAIATILAEHKTGYANHPETRRWRGYEGALAQRHRWLAAEMALRGYQEKSPLPPVPHTGQWPENYIDPPPRQFQLLAAKYRDKAPGRIPLPQNARQLWSQHKYSVLARNPVRYQQFGRQVANPAAAFDELATELSAVLRQAPSRGGIRNALQHMWGYVSCHDEITGKPLVDLSTDQRLEQLLAEVQRLAIRHQESYLLASTALSDLGAWW